MAYESENTEKKFPFLKGISGESSELLRKSAMHHSVNGKRTLIHRGDKVGGVYLVTEGALRVYSVSGRGKESTLYLIEPGESCILAMNCVFSDILYPAWVENESPSSSVTVIPGDIYKKLHTSEKSVQDFTLNVLSARIFDLMSAVEEISTLPVDQRIVNFLIKKCNTNGELFLSHDRIASHIGTAREVVTRSLKKLQDSGLIRVERGLIQITDTAGLRDYLLYDE
jgi:CRP/FNR family transcriptional regulator, anaerobic regulatory protein